MIVLKALALTIFLLAPGWLAVSLLEGRRRGKDAGEKTDSGGAVEGPSPEGIADGEGILKGREKLFLAAALGTGIVSLCALALALASAYRLWSLLLLVTMVCVALAALGRGNLSWPRRVGRNAYLACLALVAVALILTSPPSEIVFGWSDVGVYPNIAALIVRNGSQSFQDPLVTEIDPHRRDLVYVRNEGPNRHFEAFETKAFFITDMDEGTVVPQFYYLWPSLMAVFASFLGLGNMFWAVTAVSVMAFWGFFLLAERLLGHRWGLLAAAYFGISPIFLYFSKYTTSEMMNLLLFLGASICLLAFKKAETTAENGEDIRLAVCTAFFLTLGFLCHIDFILIIVPIAFCYALMRLRGRLTRAHRWFISLVMAGAALSLLIGRVFSAPYFFDVMGVFESRIGWSGTAIAAFTLAALGIALVYAKRFGHKLPAKLAEKRFNLRVAMIWLLWIALGGLFIYLYFVRPHGAQSRGVYGGLNAVVGPLYKEETLVRWGWYFSFLGVLSIYAGYALWFTRRRDFVGSLMGATGFAFTLVYSWDLHNTPLHILSMRRLVPVILPMAAIMIFFFLRETVRVCEIRTSRRSGAKWPALIATAAVFLYLFFYSVNVSVPVMGLSEGGNQLELCGQIAAEVEEDAVLILDYHMGDLYGAPLRCFYGVENAWLTQNSVLESEEFRGLLADLGYPGKPVYLLWRESISGGHVKTAHDIRLEERAVFTWKEKTLESRFTRRPEGYTWFSERVLLLAIR